jgi:hypothetical protein
METKNTCYSRQSSNCGGSRYFEIATGQYVRYDVKTKTYIIYEKDDVIQSIKYPFKQIVKLIDKDENILKSKGDVITYSQTITDICNNLNINIQPSFANIKEFALFLIDQAFGGKQVKVTDPMLYEIIDEASGGGALIAKPGIYDDEMICYDINNSYNKLFIDYNFPTNPRFTTVNEISEYDFMIYRLNILDIDVDKSKFKTNRKWYTYYDCEIFRKYKIDFELVKEDNNAIEFDDIKTNFSFLNIVNKMKVETDKTKQKLRYTILKLFLSSIWGVMCQYKIFDESEVVELVKCGKMEEPARKYIHSHCIKTNETKYIRPIHIYKFSIGIVKPFVLANARLRLLKQAKKCEKKGYEVVFSHTDSIITDAPESLFDIGKEIGQWKVEKKNEKGIIINNIASKEWIQ